MIILSISDFASPVIILIYQLVGWNNGSGPGHNVIVEQANMSAKLTSQSPGVSCQPPQIMQTFSNAIVDHAAAQLSALDLLSCIASSRSMSVM